MLKVSVLSASVTPLSLIYPNEININDGKYLATVNTIARKSNFLFLTETIANNRELVE